MVGRDPVPTFALIPELYLQDPIQVVPPHAPTSGLSPLDLETIHDYDSLMATLRFALPFYPSDPVAWPPSVKEVGDELFEEDISADMPDLWTDDTLSDINNEDPIYADLPPAVLPLHTTPVPSPVPHPTKPDVKLIGAAPFALLMKQGNFWGSISIADLEHAPPREAPARAAHR